MWVWLIFSCFLSLPKNWRVLQTFLEINTWFCRHFAFVFLNSVKNRLSHYIFIFKLYSTTKTPTSIMIIAPVSNLQQMSLYEYFVYLLIYINLWNLLQQERLTFCFLKTKIILNFKYIFFLTITEFLLPVGCPWPSFLFITCRIFCPTTVLLLNSLQKTRKYMTMSFDSLIITITE